MEDNRLEVAQNLVDATLRRKQEAGIALDEIAGRHEREIAEAEVTYFERYRHWREAVEELRALEAEDAQ